MTVTKTWNREEIFDCYFYNKHILCKVDTTVGNNILLTCMWKYFILSRTLKEKNKCCDRSATIRRYANVYSFIFYVVSRIFSLLSNIKIATIYEGLMKKVNVQYFFVEIYPNTIPTNLWLGVPRYWWLWVDIQLRFELR